MPIWKLLRFSLLTTLSLSSACQEDDKGTPPTLESVSLSGDGVKVGELSVVMGQGEFTDPDGDVEGAEIDLVDPAGTSVSLDADLTGVAGRMEAAFVIQLQVIPQVAGTHEATFVVVDEAGNRSEPVVTTFDVAE